MFYLPQSPTRAPQHRFIAATKHIGSSEDLGRGVEVTGPYGSLYFTNSKELRASLIDEELPVYAGRLEVDHIRASPAIFYADVPGSTSDAEIQRRLLECLRTARMFFVTLWKIKDHCADMELGFVGAPNSMWASNQIVAASRCADGSCQFVNFSKVELQEASNHLGEIEFVHSHGKTALGSKSTRAERALYWVQVARADYDLAFRVAHYCSALETMLSTSPSEISHRLAERVSVLLGQNQEEKLELYTQMKKAYDVRSKVIHGSRLSDSKLDLGSVSIWCDDILRRLFWLISSSEEVASVLESDNETIDKFFLQKVFA